MKKRFVKFLNRKVKVLYILLQHHFVLKHFNQFARGQINRTSVCFLRTDMIKSGNRKGIPMAENKSCAFRTSIGGQALIEGIMMRGPKKQAALIRHFRSVKAIFEASKEELMLVEGISEKLAERILQEAGK